MHVILGNEEKYSCVTGETQWRHGQGSWKDFQPFSEPRTKFSLPLEEVTEVIGFKHYISNGSRNKYYMIKEKTLILDEK